MVLRATRQDVEVASSGSGAVRVTRQFVEVLATAGATPIDESVSQGLVFSQTGTTQKTLSIPGVQSLIFGDLAENNIHQETVSQSLIFSQTATQDKTFAVGASSSFSFSQSVVVMPYSTEVAQSLIFNGEAAVPTDVDASQGFVFTQNAYGNHAKFEQNLIFTQSAGAGKIILGGLDASAIPSGLVFTDSVGRVWIKATATSHSGTDGLVFTQYAGFPKEVSATHVFSFTQTLDEDVIRDVEQWLYFSQPFAEYNGIRFVGATDGLVFQHSFIMDDIGSTCTYDPILGYSSDPDAPTPPSATAPTLVRKDYVKLFYPTSVPTTAVQIRAPMLGDRDRLLNARIQRESRGGTLQVFSDPTWPKSQILALTFTGLSETEANAVQAFFLATLGLEVGFIDWDGRTWHGLIVTPDEPFVRSRRGIVDISFEFEGLLQ
jgi:hypothetical protein